MAISETLRNAVNDKDISAIRSCFYTIVLFDPGFKTQRFDEALNFVKANHVDGVIDLHDGEQLLPEEEWNDTYFDLLASKMQDNFSEERIEQLKKVAKKISFSDAKKVVNTNFSSDEQNNLNLDSFQSSSGCPNPQNSNDKINISNNRSKISNANSSENCIWLGVVAVAIVVFGILRHIFIRVGGK